MTTSVTVVEVYVDSPTLSLDKVFDYRIPLALEHAVQPGQRVFVSFHNQFRAGMIWRVRRETDVQPNVKSILSLIDEDVVLTEEQMRLATWICERYACTMNDALGAMLPGAFRVRGDMFLECVPQSDVPDDVKATELWSVLGTQRQSQQSVLKRFGKPAKAQVEAWIESGYLRRQLVVKEDVKGKMVQILLATRGIEEMHQEAEQRTSRASKQSQLLFELADAQEMAWDKRRFSNQTVTALKRDGWLDVVARPKSRLKLFSRISADPPELTKFQQNALSHIEASLHDVSDQTMVLFGVTGSGKTEVYLRSIECALNKGKSAIVLVPEIALTPQMVSRFYSRFGERIAVLHSGLTMGERRDEWGRILRGEATIAIGARSAVFAPVRQLGLLIVDEEHEPSYKQEESPHYDAREVALERVRMSGGSTVFGSATPSLWSLHLAEAGKARMITLPTRINRRPMPEVVIVDMREELREGNKSMFSSRLMDEIDETLKLEQQVILFLNRRGFAAAVLCRACGERCICPHCDISLTVHRERGNLRLVCHYCNYEEPYHTTCPNCHEPAMRAFGVGTEQIEQAVNERWPNTRAIRMDVDTTRKRGAVQELVDRFEAGDADILIGTQMIAKGLDFPNVRLVGVIAAETLLSVPDYRANERTFQLLTQVTGRAGRAETSGLTVIQTYRPEHFAVAAAAHHDFDSFYQEEHTQRKMFSYPPFCELAVLMTTHTEERLARGAAMRFEREIRKVLSGDDVVILPASPSGIRRIEDKFRYQVVLKYPQWESVRTAVTQAFRTVKTRMNKLGGTCRLDVNAQRIG